MAIPRVHGFPALAGLALAGLALAGSTMVVAGCGSDPATTLDAYCAAVQQNIDVINDPSIATETDVAATLELYADIAERAPIGVATEWQTMVASLETAATVTPGDIGSVSAANDAALSARPAYTRIQQYTKANCGTDIGTPPPPTSPAVSPASSPPSSPAPLTTG